MRDASPAVRDAPSEPPSLRAASNPANEQTDAPTPLSDAHGGIDHDPAMQPIAPDGEQAHDRRGWWLGWPVLFFVASRLAVLLADAVSTLVKPGLHLAATIEVWDTGWYVELAKSGYPDHVAAGAGAVAQSTLGFFPLTSILIRLVAQVSGLAYIPAGEVVGVIGGLLAAVAMYALARQLAGVATARRACALFCFFPGSYALSLPYSEGVFLALALTSLLWLQRRSWLLAGAAASLAALARPTGAVLVACCAVAAGVAVHRRREWRSLGAPALACVGPLAFALYLHARTGTIFAYSLTQRRGWGQRFDLGRSTVHAVLPFLQAPFADVNRLVSMVTLLVVLVAAVALLRMRPPVEVVLFCAGVFLPALATTTLGALPRHALSAAPLLIGVAHLLRNAQVHVAVVAVSAALLVCLSVVLTTTLLYTA